MEIHGLFILRKSGIPIYHRNFSDILENIDSSLISSFFSAILEFSKRIVKKELNVLEMGDLRFFFQDYSDDEFPDGFIVILIADLSTSFLLVKERLKLICKSFSFSMVGTNLEEINNIIEDGELDQVIDTVINLRDDYSPVKMNPIKDIFENEIKTREVIAGALLSLEGQIYHSTLPREDLHTALKEVEIRSQAVAISELDKMPRLIYQSGEKMIFSQMGIIEDLNKEPINLILLFGEGTNLGIADYEMEQMAKKLNFVRGNS